MAKVEKIILVDDLDGGTGDETVSFALDGRAYEIDLSKKNAHKLRDVLQPFVTKARKAGKAKAGRSGNRPAPVVDREQNQAIRAWAKKKGFEVSERGRIPTDVVEKYHASHS